LDETLIGSHSEKDQVWLQIVALAHDLIVWTRRLLLTGELANAEPNVCSTDCSTRRRVHEAQNAPRTSLRPAAGQQRSRRATPAPAPPAIQRPSAQLEAPRARARARQPRTPHKTPQHKHSVTK
jgi:hypothetical protein